MIVTWRIGGTRSSAQFSTWVPADGRTGFVKGTRTIEEPNPLSIAIRAQLSKGSKAFLGHKISTNLLDKSDEIIEQILATYFAQSDKDAPILVRFVPAIWHSSEIVDTLEESDMTLLPHLWILPKGRMTLRESWIISSNFLDMPSQD